MREIKFRAWDKTEKVMLHWDFIEDDMLPTVLSHGDFIPMQYTGLKDKNGKEIYEGDIVRTKYKNKVLSVSLISERSGSFILETKNQYIEIGNVKDRIEIIGNIYENPELLNPHTT